MRELCDGRHENFAALVNYHSAGLSVQGPALAEAQPRSRLQWLNHPAPGFPVPGAGSYRSGQLYIRMLSGFAVEVEQISGHKATLANPRGPWPFPDATKPKVHYPDERHNNTFNMLFCDGHVTEMTQSGLVQLGDRLFLAQGVVPTYP